MAVYTKNLTYSKFDGADSFSEGLARVCIKSNYFFINKKGEMAFKKYFQCVRDFHDGMAWFEDADGKYGYIDKTGEIAIKPVYSDAWDFSEGLAPVKKGPVSGWGYIDKTGKMVIKDKYWSANSFSEGLAAVAPGFPYITYMVLSAPGP